jgi:hypothetical protein
LMARAAPPAFKKSRKTSARHGPSSANQLVRARTSSRGAHNLGLSLRAEPPIRSSFSRRAVGHGERDRDYVTICQKVRHFSFFAAILTRSV